MRWLEQGLGVIEPRQSLGCSIRALCTTRHGGLSLGSYAGLNLGDHVGDCAETVAANRQRLAQSLGLSSQPPWLRQVHGVAVVEANAALAPEPSPEADAIWTKVPEQPIAIMTADCLPVVLARADGTAVGIAHAGWRSLAAGVLECLLQAMPGQGQDYRAWFGPAIGPSAFEVGQEVRAAFLAQDPAAASLFVPNAAGRYWADLYGLAERRLQALQVSLVDDKRHCTLSEPAEFYSYRRDGVHSGRMATLAWIAP